MKKLRDLDKDEASNLEDDVEAQSDILGQNKWEANQGVIRSEDIDIYGMCKDCRWFRYVKYEFHGQKARCECWERDMSGTQRITECVSFDERGKLTLSQMTEMAWILDFKTRKVGF